AMYRCYHSRIQALRGDYELILVTAPDDYDEVSAKDFDQVVEITEGIKNIANTVKEVVKLEPDLIFFPSLGMAKWTTLLGNLRVARYQVMSYGHPASAFSKYIDFGTCDLLDTETDYQKFFQEKLIPVFDNNLNLAPHPLYNRNMQRTPSEDGVVRVAVNSSLA